MTRLMFGNDPIQNIYFGKMIPEECIFRITQKDAEGKLIIVDEGRSIEGYLYSMKPEKKKFVNKMTNKEDTMNIVKIMLKGEDETYVLLNSSLGNLTKSLVCTLASYTDGRIKISIFKGDDGYPVILVRGADKKLLKRADHANLGEIYKQTVKKVEFQGKMINDYLKLDEKIFQIAEEKNNELKKNRESRQEQKPQNDVPFAGVDNDPLQSITDSLDGGYTAPWEKK